MKVAVVGGGVSGLAAARTLQQGGFTPTVFERGQRCGGRIATHGIGPYVFDSGATSIAPRGKKLESVMLSELSTEDLVTVSLPICVHQFGRVSAGNRDSMLRYVYVNGNQKLPDLLMAGLDVRLCSEVTEPRHESHVYVIGSEVFDALVLCVPIPEVGALLQSLDASRPLQNSRYRSCLSVMLGFEAVPHKAQFHALIDPEQRNPLTWLSVESLKCQGRAPEGHSALVAQMGPMYSAANYDAPDHEIVRDAVAAIERIFGAGFHTPTVSAVKRWRYSQPETTAWFDSVNRGDRSLLVAGDGVIGGRVELAYEAGYQAARRLLESS